jgi:inactivated superfamily I helicase
MWMSLHNSAQDDRTQSDQADMAELKKWVQGSATFLEFVTQRYPDVIREFNTVQNAQMRVADTKECFQIVEAE